MKALHAVLGPRDAGPGEREAMLEMARRLLGQADVEGIDRIDVPGRGAGEEGEGALRAEVDRLIPALQSGSLFGGRRGVMVVDAHNLQVGEATVLAGLAAGLDAAAVVLVFVAEGSLPAAVTKVVKAEGESHTVAKLRDRDVAGWLSNAARERRLKLRPDAVAALAQVFGTDTAAMGQALDQLVGYDGEVTAEHIAQRFRNRPEEPMWLYGDAVSAGDTGQALRRLADFLTHGHPLQLLAFIESDLKRRALAAAAPSLPVFAEWVGASPDHFPTKKAWNSRTQASDEDLRRALLAVARADVALKSEPEATHRVTMERLTVALSRWYRGRG